MWELSKVGSIGPLMMGMSREEVAAVLAHLPTVTSYSEKGAGTMQEHRTRADPVLLYNDGKLDDVDCYRNTVGVTFNGLDLFETDPRHVLLTLAKADGNPLMDYESILFPRLRLNTGDFYDLKEKKFAQLDDPYNRRSLSVFAPGAFDDIMTEYHPVDIAQLGKA